jgi:hypothetical protein
MLKAISLKDNTWIEEGTNIPQQGPAYLEDVTILEEYDADYWIIMEYPFPSVYWKKNFIILGEHDERERLEAYQRKHQAVEGKLFEGVAAILAEEENMPQDVWERNWAAIEKRLNTGR